MLSLAKQADLLMSWTFRCNGVGRGRSPDRLPQFQWQEDLGGSQLASVEGPRAPYYYLCTNALCPTGLSRITGILWYLIENLAVNLNANPQTEI